NWTNENASGYYNRAFWKRCPCEYGTMNPCKQTADKWYPTANEPSKWTNGCSSCTDYYERPARFYYDYNTENCGTHHCFKRCPKCDGDDNASHASVHKFENNEWSRECTPERPCHNCDRCRRSERFHESERVQES